MDRTIMAAIRRGGATGVRAVDMLIEELQGMGLPELVCLCAKCGGSLRRYAVAELWRRVRRFVGLGKR